jgi:hypothetical protein
MMRRFLYLLELALSTHFSAKNKAPNKLQRQAGEADLMPTIVDDTGYF